MSALPVCAPAGLKEPERKTVLLCLKQGRTIWVRPFFVSARSSLTEVKKRAATGVNTSDGQHVFISVLVNAADSNSALFTFGGKLFCCSFRLWRDLRFCGEAVDHFRNHVEDFCHGILSFDRNQFGGAVLDDQDR